MSTQTGQGPGDRLLSCNADTMIQVHTHRSNILSTALLYWETMSFLTCQDIMIILAIKNKNAIKGGVPTTKKGKI